MTLMFLESCWRPVIVKNIPISKRCSFTELKGENVDLGSEEWLNYAADMFLPSGLLHSPHSGLIIGAQMIEKAMEDNIVLFENDSLLVRSISFAQTIFQKLKRFARNDP